jgi:hypothetical protein
MAFHLTDDGTLDTVVRCEDCGQEERYNYDPESAADVEAFLDAPAGTVKPEDGYDQFVAWALEDAAQTHECPRRHTL